MADFRFTPSTATTTIPYWIDPDTTTANCRGFWVKVSTLPVGSNAIYMYYGNSATSVGSNYSDIIGATEVNIALGSNGSSAVASAEYDATYVAARAIDGDPSLDWCYAGSGSGWVKITLGRVKPIDKINVVDRLNPTDNAQTGRVDFTSGNSINFGALPNTDPAGLDVTVNEKRSSAWVQVNLLTGTGPNNGYGEVRIYTKCKIAATEPTISSVSAEESAFFSTGTYKSPVIDPASKVVVSSISWNPSSQPTETNLAVGIRVSSYPFSVDSSTPSWLTVTNGQTLNWHGRYIQYQSTFTTTNSTTTPRLEDISIAYRVKPWQEKSVTRTPPNAFGFGGGESWTWQVPVKGGTLVTISAYIRYNTEYQGGIYDKPKLTLSGLGINESISATAGAEGSWEQRQLSGTPSSDGILTLKAEGFSTNTGGKFFIDDINISQ